MEARLYILNVEKDPVEAKRIATEAAQRLESKQLKLLELVQSIGEHLTDEDTTIRAKAIGYLAAVLSALGPRSLTRHQIPVVAQFLCDRLEDETGLKETATGLTALANMHHFGKDETTTVATALVKVDLPKHPPSTRFMALNLVDALMARHRDALKVMGDTWVTGLADLVGGEKDPRNLMIVFSVMKVILVEFDIVKHKELMFDITYCYFPITFRPPPDDPYKITAQDLKSRLRDCLAATHYFAGQVFPALIEKLDSTSPSVKLDVLQTMSACSLSYGPRTMSAQSSQLWDAVKFEILTATGDDELAIEALQVVKSIAVSLSTGIRTYPPPNTPLARYLKTIVTECLDLLKEPQQKQAKPAGRILAAVATASAPAHAFVVQTTMPALMLICSDADAIAKRRALMENLNMLFDATCKVYGTWTEKLDIPPIPNSLDEYKDKLFEIYSQALMGSNPDETSYRLTAMRGLGLLSKIRDYLPDSEIGMVVQYLDDVALEWNEKEEVRDEALRILREISTFRAKLIMDITFPAFMARLPDAEEEMDESKPYHTTLEALAKLSSERPVFEVLLTRLLNKLDVILQENCGPDYPRAILSTLLYVLRGRPQTSAEDTKAYYQRLIPRLITKTILPLVDASSTSTALSDEKVVDVIGRLFGIILRDLDTNLQKTTLDAVFDLLVFNRPSSLITENPEVVAASFRPLEVDTGVQQASVVAILAHALASSKREYALPVNDVQEFLQRIIVLAKRPRSAAHRLALLRITGLIVNKWMTQKTDVEKLDPVVESLVSAITHNTNDFDAVSSERLRVVFWIVKALLMRLEKLGLDTTSRLIQFLGNATYGVMASRGFGVLLGDDELLAQENYAVMRMLAKQRVFSLCVPKLVDGFKSASAYTKPNYLIALSNILRNVPSSVIKPELTTLLPLLLQSLDLPDVEVKSATIETLHVTILESADALKDHASSVITRLLASSVVDKAAGNTPAIRMSALRCLRSFPGALRTELLLPYKRQVMQSLMSVLDDPKRTVRKEAVDCRQKWFSLDEPDE